MEIPDDDQPRLPPVPIIMECMSWPLVQYLLGQDALHFDAEGFDKQVAGDFEVFSMASTPTHLCVATFTSEPRKVVGYLHYQGTEVALHLNLVRVHKDHRRQAIGTRMTLEVLMHPTTILSSIVSYTATGKDSQGIRQGLERLSDGGGRLCSTPFRVTGQAF